MKPGTIVKLPDGRIGTVVYNGLDGEGIKWGNHNITERDLTGNGNSTHGGEIAPDDYEWWPDAMLRNPYKFADIPCVGTDYEIIEKSA